MGDQKNFFFKRFATKKNLREELQANNFCTHICFYYRARYRSLWLLIQSSMKLYSDKNNNIKYIVFYYQY